MMMGDGPICISIRRNSMNLQEVFEIFFILVLPLLAMLGTASYFLRVAENIEEEKRTKLKLLAMTLFLVALVYLSFIMWIMTRGYSC